MLILRSAALTNTSIQARAARRLSMLRRAWLTRYARHFRVGSATNSLSPLISITAPAPAKHLADKILQSKSALEGERKQVTVLFADVKGSMELSERIDSEDWHAILDRFFQTLTEGVHRFEGTVNQYTGDGIMALFGAPIAHEDHALRACWAALHLRERLGADPLGESG